MSQTTAEYVAKARAIWGDEYDYSRTVYTGPLHRVTIVCPRHGPFQQMPYNHLNGHRCFACTTEGRRSTTAEFIARARLIFPQYDYSQVVYHLASVKVTVVCPTHGPFQRRPAELLCRRGCPSCCRKPRPKYGPNFTMENWVIEIIREVLRELATGQTRDIVGPELSC
mgnify:CR=1 FL=1